VFDYQPILRRWAVDPSRAIAKARRHRAPRGAGAQLRDTIVNAATELLIETGYAKAVSIRSVAQRAGVTSPSIYLHFADKDALLDAVCAQYFQKLDGQMQSAAAGCTTTVELLHALGMAYVRFALKTPVLYRIATMGEPRSPSDVDTVLGLRRRSFRYGDVLLAVRRYGGAGRSSGRHRGWQFQRVPPTMPGSVFPVAQPTGEASL